MAGVVVKLVLVAVIWGGSFIAGRVAAPEIAAAPAALIRYVIATVVLVAIVLAKEGGLPRLDARQWMAVALLAVTGVAAYNYLFMVGLETVPASRGSLIMALNPATTMIGAALFLREPITPAKALGAAIALAGVAVELSGGNPLALLGEGVGRGEIALFGCAVGWSAYTLVGKKLTGLSTLAATTYAALLGTAMLATLTLVRGEFALPHASPRAWAALVYMGTLGTAVAFVWFLDGVKALGSAGAAIFVNLVPVAAIALAVLLLGEPLTPSVVAGALLVIAGVWIINRPASPRAAAAIAHPNG